MLVALLVQLMFLVLCVCPNLGERLFCNISQLGYLVIDNELAEVNIPMNVNGARGFSSVAPVF